MTDLSQAIDGHYGFGGILDQILAALVQAGKNTESLSPDDLAPVDEFHTRGRDSTRELMTMAELQPSHEVLDVGCGLGGSARHIAHERRCRVTGLDLTQEYVDVAKQLTKLVGLADRVQFFQGSALNLPFESNTFDVAFTEHVQMNVADKRGFYAEIARVLRPGGCLLFHDIFQGESEAPHYPVPWAEDDSISFLATEANAKECIEQAGLTGLRWEDRVPESLQYFQQVYQQIKESGPPPIGIHLLMGDNAGTKLQNYVRNLKEKRLVVAMGRVEKPVS